MFTKRAVLLVKLMLFSYDMPCQRRPISLSLLLIYGFSWTLIININPQEWFLYVFSTCNHSLIRENISIFVSIPGVHFVVFYSAVNRQKPVFHCSSHGRIFYYITCNLKWDRPKCSLRIKNLWMKIEFNYMGNFVADEEENRNRKILEWRVRFLKN